MGEYNANNQSRPPAAGEIPLRPTVAEINLDQLVANYRALEAAVAPAPVMAVLKANAYGHGLVEVGRHLANHGATYFAVAFVEEAQALRAAGVQTPILVFGGFLREQIPLFLENDLTLTASSVEKVEQIDQEAARFGRRARVHLKFDTGMGRVGVQYRTAHSLIEAAQQCAHVDVEGVYSHLAAADEEDLDHTRLQIERFNHILDLFAEAGYPLPPLCHLANSAAIARLPEARYTMVRAGILLYGIYPSIHIPPTLPVKPALRWVSRIVYFKVQPSHHPVSYGSTWQSAEPERIVTVPVGYGDGYFRAISNKGEVLINGRRYPIVGRVCMDQFMVTIGQDSAYNGDEVVLLGEDHLGNAISIEELAEWAGTIPYEILTNINGRVPRTYKKDRE